MQKRLVQGYTLRAFHFLYDLIEYLSTTVCSGTVRTVEKDHDERMASTLKSKVQAVFPPPKGSLQLTRDEWAKNISAEVAHRMGEIQKKMVTAFNGNVRRQVVFRLLLLGRSSDTTWAQDQTYFERIH